jgi:hypothetical protein
MERVRLSKRSAYKFRNSRNQRSPLDISRLRRSRRRRRYKVNCCVKREGLCTAYAHIYRQASLSSPNEPEAKPTDQTIQANQASSTPSTPSSTGPDERTAKEPNRNQQASTSQTKRKTNGNQAASPLQPKPNKQASIDSNLPDSKR